MSITRRLIIVLVAGFVLSGAGAARLQRGETTVVDNPVLAAPEVTTTTTTALAPTTTAAPVAVKVEPGPVRPPANPYAPEPLIELGTIEIPKIGLVHRVFEGITLRTIDNGPGHWPGTVMPGQVGNTVFAGHRVTHSRPFRNIDQLAPGDHVIFNIRGVRSVYAVTGNEIVTPKALHIVNPTPTATGTIFAYHPPGSARFRYVVRLALVNA